MNDVVIFSLIMLVSVFIASCSQVLLKISADRGHRNRISEYFNLRVMIAYLMFAVSTFFGMFVLRFIPLSLVSVIESVAYAYVAILSRIILKEKITKRKLIGIIMIFSGVIIFSL